MDEEYGQYKNVKVKLRLLEALLSKQQHSTQASWVTHSGTFILKRALFIYLFFSYNEIKIKKRQLRNKVENYTYIYRHGFISCHAHYISTLNDNDKDRSDRKKKDTLTQLFITSLLNTSLLRDAASFSVDEMQCHSLFFKSRKISLF